MTDLVAEARDFLSNLNQLIDGTEMSIIKQAKENVKTRIANAIKQKEDTDLWDELDKLVDACLKCKELIH